MNKDWCNQEVNQYLIMGIYYKSVKKARELRGPIVTNRVIDSYKDLFIHKFYIVLKFF